MTCGTCSGARQSANTEYLVTLTGGKTLRVASIPEARIQVAKAGGGTYRAVPKTK